MIKFPNVLFTIGKQDFLILYILVLTTYNTRSFKAQKGENLFHRLFKLSVLADSRCIFVFDNPKLYRIESEIERVSWLLSIIVLTVL